MALSHFDLLAGALLGLALLASPARAEDGLVSEAKIGMLAHDVALFDDHTERGADVNGELLFRSPGFLSFIGAPRPNFGVTVNTLNKTDYAYAGLVWTAEFTRGVFRPDDAVFGALGLGGAIHDRSNAKSPGFVGLGTRLLFHEEADFGYRLAQWKFSLFLDHISNAGIGNRNPGLTNVGARLGYLF